MPSDALTYSFAAGELNNLLSGGKIEKITMPAHDEIFLYIRAQKTNYTLIICAGALSRVHLTKQTKPSPGAAFSFCMNLRKNICGGVIKSVVSEPHERIIFINIAYKNELGLREDKSLVLEVMGKYSNVILTDNSGRIYECIRHIPIDSLAKRPILPGLNYSIPVQDKLSPLDYDAVNALNLNAALDNTAEELLKHIRGLAPVSISEAVYNSAKNKSGIAQSLKNLFNGPVKPCVYLGKPGDFFIRPYNSLGGEYLFFESLNEAMDFFYTQKDKAASLSEKSRSLMSPAKNTLKRAQKRLAEFYEKQQSCLDYHEDKIKGEVITANIYRIKQGDAILTAENFYDDNKEIKIELDVKLSPALTAQKYFKKYAKKKRALLFLEEQIKKTQQEIAAIEVLIEDLEGADELSDLADIAEEMVREGIIKTHIRDKNIKPSMPHKYEIEGFAVFAGKNNVQNDKLTKSAGKNDIWLHIKGFSGSHVVIKTENKTVPDSVLLKAAQAAAYYSKAKSADKVEVDYTLIKYVSKPSGAAAGRVVYTNHKTILVTPKLP